MMATSHSRRALFSAIFHHPTGRALTRTLLILLTVGSLMLSGPTSSWAQSRKKSATKKQADEKDKKEAGESAKPEKPKGPAKPKEITLEANDGLEIVATYYPGNKGKETVPIVLLHDFAGSGKDMEKLAIYLQSKGNAVLLPDLRGHGESKTIIDPRTRNEIELKQKDLKKRAFQKMVQLDMGAIKSFLLDENDAGNLNVERMVVVGAGFGAVIAVNWASIDWSGRDPNPRIKVGKDVKALVLLSPPTSFKGFKMQLTKQHPTVQKKLSVMIAVGEQERKPYSAAKSLNSIFERNHRGSDEKDLYFFPLDTARQSHKLLGQPKLKMDRRISAFVNLRVAKQRKFRWRSRAEE